MLDERINRGIWLLSNVKHASMATVNADGTPHNTPYFFIKNYDLTELYWASSPQSLHSQNVERTGKIFVVLYEANQGGGLYISCINARVAKGEELKRALSAYNNLRQNFGKEALSLDEFRGDSSQRMYIADTDMFWVNYSERDNLGKIIQDMRIEVSRTDLLNK